MGFYVSEFETELKQHLNLSDQAWEIVDEDMRNFYISGSPSFSGFLNRVFSNFYQQSMANIALRYMEKSNELKMLFSSREFPPREKGITQIYEEKLLEQYEKQLIEKARSYPKGSGKKFRVNKHNTDLLKESANSEYYNDSIGMYMKAVLEEYSQEIAFKRELVFFNDIAEKIDYAISQNNKLKISILQKVKVDESAYYTRQFYVSPYKLIHDKTGSFNYLVGYAEEINQDETIAPKKVASFRLSRIDKISIMKSMNAFISKANQNVLEKEITSKTPQFMAGDLLDIKIRFTDKGLEGLKRQIYMRPAYFKKEDENTYIFTCTEVQAMNYFFKFGKDAQILEPDYLANKISKRYKDAWERYSNTISIK